MPYNDMNLRKSGIYIFKTTDKDSRPYEQHSIDAVYAFQGKEISKFEIHYKNTHTQIKSIVKVILQNDSDDIKFDMFFAKLDYSTQFG